MKNKKGQQLSFAGAPALIILFGLVVLITAAMAVGTQSFQNSQTSGSYAANISGQGLVGLNNFSAQVPTVGTMIGVGLIIVVIIAAFGAFIMNRGPGL